MNQKELLVLSVGIFLTIVAWMIIDLNHLRNNPADSAVGPVTVPSYSIDTRVFQVLQNKSP